MFNEGQQNLVCVANIATKEVLRVKELEAQALVNSETKEWFYCEKRVYKQYIQSKLPNSVVSAPIFKIKDKDGNVTIINVFIGYPSYRKHLRSHLNKSSDNKKGKFRYQKIITKTTTLEDGVTISELLPKNQQKTIKHKNYATN